MKTLAKHKHHLKMVVLAAVVLLMSMVAFAQQEVAPDHFDGRDVTITQKPRPVTHRKQAVARKAKTTAKHDQKQAANKTGGEQGVLVAKHAQ